MFEELNNLTTKVKALEKELYEKGEQAIKDALKDFFAHYPAVKSIKWSQYSPFFNDGDACVFSVHEPFVEFNDIRYLRQEVLPEYQVEQSWDSLKQEYVTRNAYSDTELLDRWYQSYDLKEDSDLADHLCELHNSLSSIETAMEGIFGNHVEVFCTRDGITVEEYNHD